MKPYAVMLSESRLLKPIKTYIRGTTETLDRTTFLHSAIRGLDAFLDEKLALRGQLLSAEPGEATMVGPSKLIGAP